MVKGILGVFVAVSVLIGLGCVRPSPRSPQDGLERLDFREVIQKAKDKVFPAVIFVKCLRESLETGKKVTEPVWGSGVIISREGEALTNWHVVEKAVEIRCLLLDGRAVNASVIGTDKDIDLALLKLELPAGAAVTPCAELGDSTVLKEGDFVMAMGAPWGLARSVSIGIVSCTRRVLPGSSEYSLWLQTDASISPGNSGGPLVNTDGQVIGINSRGAIIGGDLGFAIPAETIRLVVPRLRKYQKANWSWTGIELQPLKDFNKNIYFEGTEGVIVAQTDPESPARHAGIRMHDRILKINGKAVSAEREEDLPAVRRELGLLTKDEKAAIEFLRDGKVTVAELTPRTKGRVEGEELDCPRWDLTVKTINQFDNPDLYFQRKKGVFVYGIKGRGNARASGLGEQDIILKIDDKEVVTLEDVKGMHAAALKNIKEKHRIVFTILRNGLLRQVVLDFARDYDKD